jgi:UDP-3-O-[3-hydroxymyristoyl] N-acetylglucosamine deacetylase
VNRGRAFLKEGEFLSADFRNVLGCSLRTTIGREGCSVHTVEHLLAAAYGLGIDNLIIEIEGDEVPILDGSARPWTEALLDAGVVEQKQAKKIHSTDRKMHHQIGDSWISIEPCNELRATIEIEFPNPEIGLQKGEFIITPEIFRAEIAPARTFGFLSDLETLQSRGLAKAASLENTLAFNKGGLHPQQTLRFPDEVLRHKLLDLIGDLSLLQKNLVAHIRCRKPGHYLNTSAIRHWFPDKVET